MSGFLVSALFSLQALKMVIMIMILIILSEKDDSYSVFLLKIPSKINFLLISLN